MGIMCNVRVGAEAGQEPAYPDGSALREGLQGAGQFGSACVVEVSRGDAACIGNRNK